MAKSNRHPAVQYAYDVRDGRIPACKWVKLACERYFDDVKQQKAKGFRFDEAAALHALNFFHFLKHSKGEWCGETFQLAPWQQFIIWNVFGWKFRDTGYRRFKTVYLSVARKNGKTTWLSACGIYLFYADEEPGAEVFSAATKKDQAKISHSEATRMVKSSPLLSRRISVFKDNLSIENTASKFEPLGADSDTMDGLNVHGALIDELHAHKTRGVWDILETATGSRRQPLQIAITTAGFDRQSICYEQHTYLQKILEHIITDETYFGMIYTLDGYDGIKDEQKDDWMDESSWIKANPNIDISVKRDDLRRQCERAKQVATAQNAFLRLRMNIWTESETLWISSEQWALCAGKVDIDTLKGRRCYGGLDLSTTTDISALCWIFPPEKENEKYVALWRFWIPEDNMRERVRRDRVPYDVWARSGYITATPGNIIDYSFILRQIETDVAVFDVQELAFDRWGSQKLTTDLQDIGFEITTDENAPRKLVQMGQGFASMSAPTKELEKMVLSGELNHGGNPVAAWMMSNVIIKKDPAENYKIDKEKSRERVDGMIALVMAISRAVMVGEQASVYEERGALVL